VDNALTFQKKRNETTWLGGAPTLRASCFVAGVLRAFLRFPALSRRFPCVRPALFRRQLPRFFRAVSN
jgi:hypothetical protein